ncbi:hypothetical protein DH2020_018240 [Rehmannia glutinosa]|uniref:Clp R domain-containing protein n=1 Tax=Rehmannia glutinosa TaxID=99300 RepID=A0ABR0WID8_REHGL
MRTGGCAVQQALTPEAAAIVTQAVALAKRRGHAQVTPLHVANTMLAAPTGLLRAACQQSHSHPLQCKALELCFNVALNRLPAGSPSFPMLSNQYYPSISNALVAAFKRAQAHHRRGSVENQIPCPKIELEQLVISILDDPSVSRVMREAGFSSPQVKSNVEKVVSLETSKNEITITSENDDVCNIIESLLTSRKRRSLVIVGECVSKIEITVKKLMDRIDRGNVPKDLREVKFISISPLYSFCNLQRHLVEQKMGELFCLVKSLVSKGVVLYLGDLNWISEYRVRLEKERSYYCSVEHMIMEIGRLVNCGTGENIINEKFWVMGIANFQTYMRCRNGFNSLEDVWRLSPVSIPADQGRSKARHGREENGSCRLLLSNGEVKLNCCADCSSKFEAEAKKLKNSCDTNKPKLSNLPPWLKDESRRLYNNDQVRNVKKKMFAQAMSVNPHRVFLLDDLEQADYFSRMGIKRAIERGRIRNNENGEEVSFCDAIIVLCCERFRSRSSRACSLCTHKLTENGGGAGEEEEMSLSNCGPLDLNISFRDDDSVVDGQDIDALGILENVDRCVVFKF